MTPTDRDRWRVAAELRRCRGGWSSGECYYTIINALGLPDTSREDGGAALYARLADLIEPPARCPHYMHPCCRTDAGGDYIDRDALLELTDEMEGDARYWLDRPYDQLGSHDVIGYAERIRKAVGVEHGD